MPPFSFTAKGDLNCRSLDEYINFPSAVILVSFLLQGVGLSLGFIDFTGGDMVENEDLNIGFMQIHNGR